MTSIILSAMLEAMDKDRKPTIDERLEALAVNLELLSVNVHALQEQSRQFEERQERFAERQAQADERERRGRRAVLTAIEAYLRDLNGDGANGQT